MFSTNRLDSRERLFKTNRRLYTLSQISRNQRSKLLEPRKHAADNSSLAQYRAGVWSFFLNWNAPGGAELRASLSSRSSIIIESLNLHRSARVTDRVSGVYRTPVERWILSCWRANWAPGPVRTDSDS